MKTIFVIGGMGAGKSSVTRILASQGLAVVDLDQVGHDVLLRNDVKCALVRAFGVQVLDDDGAIDRAALAAAAFASHKATQTLNNITHPRIEQELREKLERFAAQGFDAAVVELSSFDGTRATLNALADCMVLVCAPEQVRVERAVAAGWDRAQVRARIAQQMSDEQRASFAAVRFVNDGSLEQLENQVASWWRSYQGGGCQGGGCQGRGCQEK